MIVTGRRQAVLDAVKAQHPKLHTIQSDIADPEQIAALAAQVKAEFPRLDVLMNNAGVGASTNLRAPAHDLAGLTSEVDINLGGVIRMTSALIDILTANQGHDHQRVVGPGLRAAAVKPDLQRDEGRGSFLHAVAAVPAGGFGGRGHRIDAARREDRNDRRMGRARHEHDQH